jgi:LysR family hydrogen peroxide-inducible transcriptional activator
MQFHQVRYFLAACDTLNFTRAAEACNVSQPALTVAIRKLEDSLGGRLFVRDRGHLELTELGRLMRVHLGRIEESRAAARHAANDLVHGEMEMIDLGLMCTLSPGILLGAITRWQSGAPDVEFLLHDVQEVRALDLLLSGELDCALVARTAPLPERFVTRRLMSEPMVVAMSRDHPLGKVPEIGQRELSGVPYIDRLRCEFRLSFFAEMRVRELSVNVVMRAEREDWVCEAVKSGIGISIMPQSSAGFAGLHMRPITDLNVERTIETVTVAGRQVKPAVENLIDSLAGFDWNESA